MLTYLFYHHFNNFIFLVYILSLGLDYLNLFLNRNRKPAFIPLDLHYLGITHKLYARPSHVESVEIHFNFQFCNLYNLKGNYFRDLSIA